MKIVIIYELKTAYGNKAVHDVVAHTPKEAEELCQRIEQVGYKILDVTRQKGK